MTAILTGRSVNSPSSLTRKHPFCVSTVWVYK